MLTPALTLDRLRELLPLLEDVWSREAIGVLSWRLLPPEIQRFYQRADQKYQVRRDVFTRRAPMWQLLGKFCFLEKARRQSCLSSLARSAAADLDLTSFWYEGATGHLYIRTRKLASVDVVGKMQELLVADINLLWV
jgi:hypothetical protein